MFWSSEYSAMPRIQSMSAPAQNVSPSVCSTTALVDRSILPIAEVSSAIRAASNAFLRSGRAITRRATPLSSVPSRTAVTRAPAPGSPRRARVSGVDVFAVAGETTDPSIDAIGQSCLDGEVARGLLVGRRNLDVHRARGTRTDEIELQRTDPSADLEDRPARDPPGDKEVADHPRSAAETIPPVGASVRSRAVGVEDANETVRIAARGHGTNFSASGRRARPP